MYSRQIRPSGHARPAQSGSALGSRVATRHRGHSPASVSRWAVWAPLLSKSRMIQAVGKGLGEGIDEELEHVSAFR